LGSTVAIGEGEKDRAPRLFNGEMLGHGKEVRIDLAVDPVDGTRAASLGVFGSVTALAAAPAGRMFRPGSVAYMEKLVGPPGSVGQIHLDMPAPALVEAIARLKGKALREVQVAILERPRNEAIAEAVRATGAKVVALPFADLSACIAVAMGTTSLDLLIGIGGCPEGVIAAVAAEALGATMQGRLWARSVDEEREGQRLGLSFESTMHASELVGMEGLSVSLTGVTGSEAVQAQQQRELHTLCIHSELGVRYTSQTLTCE